MKASRRLEELESVDWASLQHCYGPATSVPNALRDVASPIATVYDEALVWLRGTICHQGSVYEATAATVPFLLGLVENPDVRCKKEVLVLLAMISISYAHLSYRTCRFYELIDLGMPPSDNLESWVVTVKAARHAVRLGLPVICGLLRDPKIELSCAAIGVVACFKEESPTTLPLIQNLNRPTSDEVWQASLSLALGSLAPPEAKLLEHLSQQVSATESELVSFAAAVALSKLTGGRVPAKARRVLRSAINPSEALVRQYRQLPWIQVYWDTDNIAAVARDELASVVKTQ